MTFKELKKRFENLGYDLEYVKGRGYYLRKFGTTNYQYYKNCRAAIETRLELLADLV